MAKQSRGPWGIHDERVSYDNPWVRVREFDVTRPDGKPGLYGVVEPKNLAIGILPLFENGDTLLVGQYRFALDAYSWELPEGGGPMDVEPLVSAQRELEEETGYSAQYWKPVCSFDISNSITNERAEAFLAWNLSSGEPRREGSEADMSVKRLPLREVLAMTMSGGIRDGFTIMMVLTALRRAQNNELNPDLARLILKALE